MQTIKLTQLQASLTCRRCGHERTYTEGYDEKVTTDRTDAERRIDLAVEEEGWGRLEWKTKLKGWGSGGDGDLCGACMNEFANWMACEVDEEA